MRSSRNVTISVRVPLDMARKAKRRAKQEKMSLSGLFRRAYSSYETGTPEVGPDLALVYQLAEEVRNDKRSPEEIAAEEKEVMAYTAAQFRRAGIRERDAVRLVREVRSERRAT